MKICVCSLGCKVNQYESDSLKNALKIRGHEIVAENEFADVFVINTCAVTNEAEKKSRKTVSRLRSLSPNAKIVVTGCAAQKDPEQFFDLENVAYVCGTKNKLALIDNLENHKIEIEKFGTAYDEAYVPLASQIRAYVKIQDGCNNFCSYCIIPYLRGRSRSRNIVEILSEVSRLMESAKEIVITGINITDYRIDNEPAFCTLLEELSKFDIRIRIGSLEETLVDEKFLKIISGMKNLCPHFHLSLQSGSLEILKKMNRHYTPSEFFESIEKIRKILPKANISTDVIVGFPGEGEKEFVETYNFIKKVKFASLHIFPYSKRSETVASKMPQVHGTVKKERVLRLEKLNAKLQKNYIKKCRFGTYSLLIEEKKDGYFIGHTENYVKCYLKANKKSAEIGENMFASVKIRRCYLDGAKATLARRKK
ncbi:MAG: tRNA (N(6)-L-threonylcarbamoyladenosine(37)-C(2))-methylthiotransferase MtaB [Clostridia bacterium]